MLYQLSYTRNVQPESTEGWDPVKQPKSQGATGVAPVAPS